MAPSESAVNRYGEGCNYEEEPNFMKANSFWTHLALGAAAGLASTMAMQVIRTAEQKWIPGGAPPIQADPGRFMIHKAAPALPQSVRQRVHQAEGAVSKLLAMGYGMTFGALYAVIRPEAKRVIREGVLLGLAAWAVGYLGWLPATGLMPPIWKHKPKQIVTPVAEHALFGLAITAGHRWLHKLVAAH